MLTVTYMYVFLASNFFSTSFFSDTSDGVPRSALSYFCSAVAAASLQGARYGTKEIQIWLHLKGCGLKSQSLNRLAFIKGDITASH